MINKRFLAKMLVMVLVFGITTVECFGQSFDSNLNGTWVFTHDKWESFYIFNNGIYEDIRNGVIYEKGTYTTNNGIIFFQPTHITHSIGRGQSMLYSRDEYRNEYGKYYYMLPSYELDEIFKSYQLIYSINGNSLTITEDGDDFTYTKKTK